jgi:predicted phage terminase large subunit-like protein
MGMSDLPVDMALLDDTVTRLPEDMRKNVAEMALGNLFMFASVCGFNKLSLSCHGPVCTFIDKNGMRFKLILMPRDHYKTSLITISGNLQKAVKNAEERILIANETSTNSQRFLRSIRQIAEKNRIFRALYSHVIPKDTRSVRWNDQEIDFVRQGYYPEPTFDTIGMTGAMTSRHYTHLCFDDPISEEAIKSDKVMKDTIERMGAVINLMSEPRYNSLWLVGTRWGLHDVYSHHEKVYGTRLAKLIRSVVEDGQIIFPELIDDDTLALIRESMSAYKFSCLMMNKPRNDEIQDLNIQDLRYWEYTDESEQWINLRGEEGVIRTLSADELDISVTVDLAPAERVNSDRNAVTTVGTSGQDVIVLDSWARRCTPGEVIEKLFALKRRFHPRVFGIEGVAYQKAFKWFLRDYADEEQLYLNIKELSATGKKEIRIRGLQPIMARKRLYIHPSHHILFEEMSDFPLGEHDDAVDSLSMHLQLFINQLKPANVARRQIEEARVVAKILGRDPDSQPDYEYITTAFTGIVG